MYMYARIQTAQRLDERFLSYNACVELFAGLLLYVYYE